VARDIREALSLLVRAGICDDELFQRLALAVGSMDRARAVGRELVDHLKGLPEHLRDWLLGKPARTKSSLATESQERALDEVIAELLIETSRLSQLAGPLRQNTVVEIAVVAPQTADSVRSFVTMCESMANTIRLLASRRALQIRDTTVNRPNALPLSYRGPVQRICSHFNTDGEIKLLRACGQRGSNIAIISGYLPKCSFLPADSLALNFPVPHKFTRAFGLRTECSYCFTQPGLRK
jgi:hypothetical protein